MDKQQITPPKKDSRPCQEQNDDNCNDNRDNPSDDLPAAAECPERHDDKPSTPSMKSLPLPLDNNAANDKHSPQHEAAGLANAVLSQVDCLVKRNYYLEQVVRDMKRERELSARKDSAHERKMHSSRPTEFKHLAGSQVTFGEFSITLPTRETPDQSSVAQSVSQGSSSSDGEVEFTPDTSIDEPAHSDTDTSTSSGSEQSETTPGVTNLPVSSVENPESGFMTFYSEDGSIEFVVELRVSNRRHDVAQQLHCDPTILTSSPNSTQASVG